MTMSKKKKPIVAVTAKHNIETVYTKRFHLECTNSRWKDRGTQSGQGKCIFVEIDVGFYPNRLQLVFSSDASCIHYLHFLRKNYVPMHKRTEIRLNVALQRPYDDNVRFNTERKKKTYISPWAYHHNTASDKNRKKRKVTNVIKKKHM